MTMKGCVSILFVLMMAIVIFFSGTTSLARSFADWRTSADTVRITEINADVAVRLAEINSDTAVQLAEINADVTKKTSGTFVMFYLVRGLMWGAGILCAVGLVGLVSAIRRGGWL